MRQFAVNRFSSSAASLVLIAGVLGSSQARAQNTLAQVAASLPAGSWQQLTTTNIGVLNQSGTDGNILTYGADAVWDPGSRKLLYIGNDHIDSNQSEALRFVIYSADTNSWRNMPAPPWSQAGVTDHGYYEHGIDVSRGVMYRRAGKMNRTFGVFNIATEAWTTTATDTALNGSSPCCSGVDYFPELGGLVHAQGGEPGGGKLRLLETSTGQWSSLAENMTSLSGGTFTYGAYNPVAQVMIFGQNSVHYKLTAGRAVQQIASPPFTVYDGSGYLGILTADPASGEYVALSAMSRNLYSYNVSTNTWQTRTSTNKPNLQGDSVVAVGVPNYGVILYVTCDAADCSVYVYKHQAGGPAPPPPTVPNPPGALTAN
jgi:hypothetical protein